MARPLRIEYEGALYHVTSRGNARGVIYYSDKDCRAFLHILSSVLERFNWACYAYCLMGNHYHLVVETRESNLSRGMKHLNGVYTQAFNATNQRTGHVFEGRYKAILVDKERYFLEVCRYVVLNSVRAGIAAHPADWKWSSYIETSRGTENILSNIISSDEVVSRFDTGTGMADAVKRYTGFVMDGVNRPAIWRDLKGNMLLGGDDFCEKLSARFQPFREARGITRAQRFADRPPLEKLFHNLNGGKRLRNKMIHDAAQKYGYSQREIAGAVKLHRSVVGRIIASADEKEPFET